MAEWTIVTELRHSVDNDFIIMKLMSAEQKAKD